MQRDWLTRLKSRKFLMVVANFIFILINEVLERPVDPGAYWAITGGIVAFVLGEAYTDASH